MMKLRGSQPQSVDMSISLSVIRYVTRLCYEHLVMRVIRRPVQKYNTTEPPPIWVGCGGRS